MTHPALHRAPAVSRGDSLATYLHEIRRYPLLSRADECALSRRIRDGDADALSTIVCSNLRFVVSVAKPFQNRGVPLEDLIDEGNLGLIRAAEKFDETRGVKFITYAVWWIRQAVLQAVSEQSHTVRVPMNRVGDLRRLGDRASAVPLVRSYLSLDASFSPSDDGTLLDYLPDDHASAPDEQLADGALSVSVARALATLERRQAKVLSMYFGLDGTEPMTLEEIGRAIGVTRERTRQIKEKALWHLRHSSQARILESYCGQ